MPSWAEPCPPIKDERIEIWTQADDELDPSADDDDDDTSSSSSSGGTMQRPTLLEQHLHPSF